MSSRPCDECGCKIEFITGPNGKGIPVQRVRTVYRIDTDTLGTPENPVLVRIELSPGVFCVSHFETCSNPSRFSRKG